MTAVVVYEKMAQDNLDQAQALKWVADRTDQLGAMDLPVIIKRELRKCLLTGNGVASTGTDLAWKGGWDATAMAPMIIIPTSITATPRQCTRRRV